MKPVENDHFEFSNGKRVYAYGQILGLDADLHISYGSDGALATAFDDDGKYESSADLTPDEVIEMSKYMISLWEALLSKAREKSGVKCLRVHMHTPEQGCWEDKPLAEREAERDSAANVKK